MLSELGDITSVDLTTGRVRALGSTKGVASLDRDLLVSGTGGSFRARSMTTGRLLWTYRADHADPVDGTFGTGVASVLNDSVLTTSYLDGRTGRVDGNRHGVRVSLLDRNSGAELATGVIPKDHSVRDVMALPGHRGLIATTDDRLWLISASS